MDVLYHLSSKVLPVKEVNRRITSSFRFAWITEAIVYSNNGNKWSKKFDDRPQRSGRIFHEGDNVM